MRSRLFLGAALAAMGLALALAATGCGPNALRDNARAALVVTAAVETAGDSVDAARTERLDRVEAAVANSPDREAIVRREAARWEPVGAALDACRDAVLTWVESLELARVAGGDGLGFEDFVPLVLRVVLLYDDVARLATSLGVEVPELPAFVRALASAPEGR